MIKNKKKGQAAIEFLMTYGWAFLVILVVIGAFMYFDVLNPGKLVPDSCRFPAGFECTDSFANETHITITARNNLGSNIESGAELSLIILRSGLEETINKTHSNTWRVGRTAEFIIDWDALGMTAGERVVPEDFSLTYTEAGSAHERTVQGSLSITVN